MARVETEFTPPLPHRAYGTSAGLDLFCGEENIIDFEPMDGKVIRTGYRIHQNKISSFGLILGRSSLNAKGIFVTPGVIDNDYTGELFITLLNLSKNKVSIIVQAVCVSKWFKNAAKEPCPECQDEFAPEDIQQMHLPNWRVAKGRDDWSPEAWEAFMELENKSREQQRQKMEETSAQYMARLKEELEELWENSLGKSKANRIAGKGCQGSQMRNENGKMNK